MTKLVVFDVDGTFLDSMSVFRRVIGEYSAANALPDPCVNTIMLGYGDPMNHDFKWGVDRDVQLRHLHGVWNMGYAWELSGEADKTPVLFDGVVETLTHLKDLKHRLAIVTSKAEAPLLHLLEHHGLQKFFCAHRSGTDVERRGEKEKPEPDQLLSVMRQLKFGAEETVMIGDTTMDIRMGRAAGTQAVGVTWGCHPRDYLEQAGAHHIVETRFNDIAPTVSALFD